MPSNMDPASVRRGAQDFIDFMEHESTRNNGYRGLEYEVQDYSRASSVSQGSGSIKGRMQIPTADLHDSRHDIPKTWNEANALFWALEPTRMTFFRVTGQEPPQTQVWRSYTYQVGQLQKLLNRLWAVDDREGAAPTLAQLGSWTGGIEKHRKAKLEVTEESVDGSEHREVLAVQEWWAKRMAQENEHRFEAIETMFSYARI